MRAKRIPPPPALSAPPPPSMRGSKSGELGVGMCQRHGAPANCYKPVARRRVCVEVRSSQVESGEGNPGSALAKQTNAPGLAGRAETRSVEGLICCLLDGADGRAPEHAAGLSGYFAPWFPDRFYGPPVGDGDAAVQLFVSSRGQSISGTLSGNFNQIWHQRSLGHQRQTNDKNTVFTTTLSEMCACSGT